MAIPPRPRRPADHPDGRARQKQGTKDRLVEAAARCFAERGYEATSVSEIAEAAGVVPSLINTYFLGKAGLLYAVVQRHNAPQFAAIAAAAAAGGTPLDRLDRVVAAMAEMDLREPRLLAALQSLSWAWPPETEAQNLAELRPVFDLLGGLVRDGIAAGQFRPLPVADAVALAWAAYTQGLRPAVFGQAAPADAAARVQALLRSLLLRADPDRPDAPDRVKIPVESND
ncbi:TetR/AcrR family transcriptional regulator [Paracraurococcus ruber]|uniref:TetR/AcrR family transcriptional regulator n=1 Tax=Paracraurococcus ruber TaxID=77675 RepID=UPI0019056596|nr:TetR/AcrR family transcriptional regulator [Paracraurococcus ruber]